MADMIVTPSSDSGSGALALVLVVLLIVGGFLAAYNWNTWFYPQAATSSNTEINVTAPPQAPSKDTTYIVAPEDKPDTNIIVTPKDDSE
ncbi:MAG: hypothetical protein ABI743_11045 [bacterium]